MKKRFRDLPSAGIWKGRPQTDIEAIEKMREIERLFQTQLVCNGDITYGCLDLRELE